MPISSLLPFPSNPSSPRQVLIFLSLQIFLFWTLCINGIIQYLVFCDYSLLLRTGFSRFIHVACISSSFFLLLSNTPLYGYTILYTFINQAFLVFAVGVWKYPIIILKRWFIHLEDAHTHSNPCGLQLSILWKKKKKGLFDLKSFKKSVIQKDRNSY